MGVSVYWALKVLCVFAYVCICVCLCLCEIKSEYQQKKHYVSDLSKLIVCTRPRPLFFRGGGVGPPTGKEGVTFFQGKGGSFYKTKLNKV